MYKFLIFFLYTDQPSNPTSTWKRTSANGLLKEDSKNVKGGERIEDINIDKYPTDENIRNNPSGEGPQFSTFFRVRDFKRDIHKFYSL